MEVKDTILAAITVGLLPQVNHAEDRPLNKQDFDSHVSASYNSLEKVEEVLEEEIDLDDSVIQVILIFCAQHCPINSEQINLYWSSSKHQSKAEKIQEKLLLLSRSSDIVSFLTSNNKKHLTGCLGLVLPKLEESFLKHPGEQHALAWLLVNLPHPHLANQLSRLLPHPLRWLDHWIKDNQILGAKVTKHIVLNSPPTELKWYGRDNLLASALLRLLHSREIEVLKYVCDPLFEIIKIQHNGTSPDKPGPADRLIEQVINRLALESNQDTCSPLTRLLSGLVDTLGTGVARWLPKLAVLLEGQLDHPSSGEAEVELIQMWKKVILVAPECANREAELILKSVVKLMYKTSLLDQSVENARIVKECSSCLELMAQYSPASVLEHCRGLESININATFDCNVSHLMHLARESLYENEPTVEIVSH